MTLILICSLFKPLRPINSDEWIVNLVIVLKIISKRCRPMIFFRRFMIGNCTVIVININKSSQNIETKRK